MRHYILIQRVITKTALYAFLSQEYRVFYNNPFWWISYTKIPYSRT